MFSNLVENAKKTFTIIGTSAGGITAVLYVVGFLVVRAKLSFFGLSHISIDTQEYLLAGGRFFTYLPNCLLFAISILLSFFSDYFESTLFGFAALAVFAAIYFILKIKIFKRARAFFTNILYATDAFLTPIALIALMVLTITIFLSYFLELPTESNWIFNEAKPELSWLVIQDDVSAHARQVYFARLFFSWLLVTILFAILITKRLRQLALPNDENAKESERKSPKEAKETHGKFPIIDRISMLTTGVLLIAQLLLLPWHFGILLTSRTYPQVDVQFKQVASFTEIQNTKPLLLLHQQSDELYLYSASQRKLWQIDRSEIQWILTRGTENIFKNPNPETTTK